MQWARGCHRSRGRFLARNRLEVDFLAPSLGRSSLVYYNREVGDDEPPTPHFESSTPMNTRFSIVIKGTALSLATVLTMRGITLIEIRNPRSLPGVIAASVDATLEQLVEWFAADGNGPATVGSLLAYTEQESEPVTLAGH